MNDIVEGAWSLFRKSVVSPEAGPEQLSQTRDAFIAGAEMLFTLLTVRDFARSVLAEPLVDLETMRPLWAEGADR